MDRIQSHHSRKYRLNERFFDVWSSEMAYVLGFWFADGFMRHEKSYRIAFFSQDKELLEDVKNQFDSDHPIRKRKDDDCWEIILFSKHLYQKLEGLGGIRGKSFILRFPQVPDLYIADFIRGYFDGDGSIFYVQYIMTKNQEQTRELRSNFTSGSRIFLEELMEILHQKLNMKKKILGRYNDGHSWKLGYGIKDTRKLINFMYYPDCPIALQRKKNFLTLANK